jgi:hypothetical protein
VTSGQVVWEKRAAAGYKRALTTSNGKPPLRTAKGRGFRHDASFPSQNDTSQTD